MRNKRVYNLKKVYDSGIVDYILISYNHPKAIMLFGSYSRGEDTENSDIDIAVLTRKNLGLDLIKYEKILKKKVNVHEIDLDRMSSEFKSNLANGIVLEGSW